MWRSGDSVDARGSRLVVSFMPPLARALGGRLARNSRVDREAAENGLNFVFTSVMNLVIMLGGCFFTFYCQIISYI